MCSPEPSDCSHSTHRCASESLPPPPMHNGPAHCTSTERLHRKHTHHHFIKGTSDNSHDQKMHEGDACMSEMDDQNGVPFSYFSGLIERATRILCRSLSRISPKQCRNSLELSDRSAPSKTAASSKNVLKLYLKIL